MATIKKTVSRAIHRKLPSAGRPSIKFSSFWLKWQWMYLKKEVSWPFAFFTKMRGANFLSLTFGPIKISIPMRWLEEPARLSHPKVFE